MDFHRVANVARQIRRFSSHPKEAFAWCLTFESPCQIIVLPYLLAQVSDRIIIIISIKRF